MLRTFLVAQTLVLLSAALLMLGAVVARKAVADRRAALTERGRAEVCDGVFAFVASDGEDCGSIRDLVPDRPARLRHARISHICSELLRLTTDLRGEVKARASHVIQDLGWADTLVEELHASRRDGTRARAASTLGEIASSGAPPLALVRALRDTDAAVRICATRALGRYGDPAVTPALLSAAREGRVASGIVAEALVALGPAIATTVMAGSGDVEPCVRRMCVDVAGALRLPETRHVILQRLDDPDLNVRVAAARALGRIGWPDTAAELSRRCTAGDPALRLAAVESTIELQAPDGLPVLTAALGDTDHLIAHKAARGLAAWARTADDGTPTGLSARGVLDAISRLDTQAGAYAREALARLEETGA